MTNRQLYNEIMSEFPDVTAGYWSDFPFTKYSNKEIEEAMFRILKKLEVPKLGELDTVTLSERQRYLAHIVTVECLNSGSRLKGDAIHQLADCVDNFGEKERQIYPTEHLLYYNLISCIILAVRK